MAYQPQELITTGGEKRTQVFDQIVADLLRDILTQLKIQNAYLQVVVGEKLTELDMED